MKKFNLLSIFVFLVTLSFISCEEEMGIDVNTTFNKNIKIDITESKKSTDTLSAIPFYSADTLDISDNDEIQKNLDKIKELEISKVTCTLTGIPENESITELNLLIPEAALNITLKNLTQNNTSITLDVSTELLDGLAAFLFANYKITIQTSGFSTYAPMQLGVDLSFESTIKTGL